MIVGININAIGDRYIAGLYLNIDNSRHDKEAIANLWLNHYDEVYIIDFDNCCDDFINEIVLKGCRIS